MEANGYKSENQGLPAQTGNEDRHDGYWSLLLLINSASYKMSTTSHTDGYREGVLMLHALRTSISRSDLSRHPGLGSNHRTLLDILAILVCIALKYRSNQRNKQTPLFYVCVSLFRYDIWNKPHRENKLTGTVFLEK